MTIQTYRWHHPDPLPSQIAQELHVLHPVMRQLLYNRDITSLIEAKDFLEGNPPQEIQGAHLLHAAESARRLKSALEKDEHIAVYGDFDVDGITATALVKAALSSLGGDVSCYIPDRVSEGYGLNVDAIRSLRDQGADLLITVDCGIRATHEVQIAKEIGFDVIITDHHQPGETLPQADFIVNPNLASDPYPNKALAGVGVVYKLMENLSHHYPALQPEQEYLDLVALGTVADLVPLQGENRHLVKRGLKQLQKPHRQGILSLMGVAGVSPETLQASDISFQLAPRLNAAGRLTSAKYALELLLEEDVHRAGRLAQEIELFNNRRKELMRDMRSKAEEIAVPDDAVPPMLFAFHPDFNQGIVGLAAGYLSEKYHRPAIVGKDEGEVIVASCRSIDGFNIVEALDHHRDLFQQYGGHPAAAGFTIENQHIPELRKRLTEFARRSLAKLDLTPSLEVDAVLDFDDLNYQLLSQIQQLSPMGYGNPQPLFLSEKVDILSSRQVGGDGSHLKLTVSQGGKTLDAIAFRLGHLQQELPSCADILYTFEENEFRGRTSLQLNVKDFRPPLD